MECYQRFTTTSGWIRDIFVKYVDSKRIVIVKVSLAKKNENFIVWTSEDIQVERIYPNREFWLHYVSRAELLFKNLILPDY